MPDGSRLFEVISKYHASVCLSRDLTGNEWRGLVRIVDVDPPARFEAENEFLTNVIDSLVFQIREWEGS